jgi:hypothetical protein
VCVHVYLCERVCLNGVCLCVGLYGVNVCVCMVCVCLCICVCECMCVSAWRVFVCLCVCVCCTWVCWPIPPIWITVLLSTSRI